VKKIIEAPAIGPLLPILSIGSNSDTVLDQFNLGDDILSHLQTLVGSVRNTHGEQRLPDAPWNMNYEQALNLAQVLHQNLTVEQILNALVGIHSIW